MKKTNFFFIFSLILLIGINIVGASYSNVGGNSLTYYQGNNSKFNDLITGDMSITRALGNPEYAPLIEDLDNDGELEIIVFDDPTIRIYDSELILQNTLTTSIAGDSKALIYIKNMGGSDLKEIMVFRDRLNSGSISYGGIYNYNGTHAYSIRNVSAPFGSIARELALGCNDLGQCLLVGAKSITGGASTVGDIKATGFNITHTGNVTEIDQTGSVAYPRYCLSRFRTIPVVDQDNDGIDEFIITYLKTHSSLNKVGISTISLHDDLTPIIETDVEGSENTYDISPSSSSVTCKTSLAESIFTSPLVFDMDGVQSNGLELVYGAMTDSDEFRMYSYEWTGSAYSSLDSYPKIYEADGQLISNVFRATAQSDSPINTDFCVMGIRKNIDRLDVVCASEQATGIETIEYNFDISTRYNITDVYGSLAVMAHSIQSDGDLTDGNDLTEILTSYGIFRLESSGGSELLGNPYDLTLLWESPQQNIAIVPQDLDNKGWQDLIGITSSNLWVYQDNTINEQPDITGGTVNPPLYVTWKINTSLEIRVQITDAENDLVSAKVVIYEGHSNEQNSGWQENFTSGTTFPFTGFQLNQTIGAGTITIYYKDNQHTENLSRSYPFSVANDGAEFGSGISEIISDEIIEAEAEDNITYTPNNNNLRTAVINTSNSIGVDPITILLLGIIAITITCLGSFKENPVLGLGVAGVLNMVALFLFVQWELISNALFISLFFLVIGGIITFMFWKYKGNGGGV